MGNLPIRVGISCPQLLLRIVTTLAVLTGLRNKEPFAQRAFAVFTLLNSRI